MTPRFEARPTSSVLVVNRSLIKTGSLITTAIPKIGRFRVKAVPYRLARAPTRFARAPTKPSPAAIFGIGGAGGSRTGSVVAWPMYRLHSVVVLERTTVRYSSVPASTTVRPPGQPSRDVGIVPT